VKIDGEARRVARSIYAEFGDFALQWPTVRRSLPRYVVWVYHATRALAVARGIMGALR
jgi:hypothetical protein